MSGREATTATAGVYVGGAAGTLGAGALAGVMGMIVGWGVGFLIGMMVGMATGENTGLYKDMVTNR